ncbi:UBX domain-containing protein 4 isoform X2 [Bacillus rossius redtenbacheri]|uniref:UBX domain-containing protein 4 isoform X2 n=1 Tax=Bacillus rossius redtenbacheri TaxID=93214 RepID=UPI002FDDE45E
MRWFEAGISEAVTSAKSKNAVFVVFVEGPDPISQNIAATINSAEVSSKLESNDFVAIKLSSDSQLYTQFSQIYHIVPVPSIFFIGGNGVPVEVVAGQISVPDLAKKIDGVLEKHKHAQTGTLTPGAATPQPQPAPSAPSAPSAPAAEGRTIEARSVLEPSTSSSTASSGGNADGKSELVSSEDREERMERAKELLEKKRAQKQKEEEEKEREKELERRKVGQDVQKLRRWQQEQEMKRLLEERQREKQEAEAAKERVRRQIEEDKAERAARFNTARKQEQEARERVASQAADSRQSYQSQSDVARIQFRLPDGTTNSHQFAASSTLAEVRRYVIGNIPLPSRDFTLSTTFPRRDLTPSDNGTTLQDLQLTPTAVILVVPAGVHSSPASSMDLSVAKRFMWTLIAPVLSILTYVRGLIFGQKYDGAAAQPGDGSQAQPRESTSQQNLRRRNVRESAIRREGNVHRLSNQQDSSDDENNTWNGNSTQQM